MVLFLRIVCEFLAQFDGCFEVFCPFSFGHCISILRITAFDYSFGMFKGQKKMDKTLQNNHQIGQEIHTQSSKIVPSLLKGHSYQRPTFFLVQNRHHLSIHQKVS
jgi:hypothetical protein